MSTWSKAVLRTIGALDAILSVLGLYLLLDPIWRGLFALNPSAGAPHFKIVFLTMLVANAVLLLFFVLAAVQLLRLKRSGVTAHATASALLVVYEFVIAALWALGGPVGTSVAAATGVGNLGIAPFQCFNLAPFVYPIASTVLLLVTLRKMAACVVDVS
jgi:hypothetical protein